MPTIGSGISEQYDRIWEMLRSTVERFTEEQWKTGPADRAIPVRWAYHIVVSVDFYTQPSPEGYDWHARPGFLGDVALLPDRAALLEYVERAARAMRERILGMAESEFMEPSAFPWTGETKLAHFIYVLRHATVHLGEMAMLLRLNGAEEAEWR